MIKCIALLLVTAVAIALSEPVQFGLFNFNPTYSPRSTTTRSPKKLDLFGFLKPQTSTDSQSTSKPTLNILKPVTSLLTVVGKTVQSLLNLLAGGLRYRPYKRITTPQPSISNTVTSETPLVSKVDITIPENATNVSVSSPITPTEESSTEVSPPISPTAPVDESTVEDSSPITPSDESSTEVSPIAPVNESTIEVSSPRTPTDESSTEVSPIAPVDESTIEVSSPITPTDESSTEVSPPISPTAPANESAAEVSPSVVPTDDSTIMEPTTESITPASITEKGKPENVDWRRLNCSSPVQFQGQCRASFAFAITATIEAQTCFKTGKYITLSAQNLLDCTIEEPFDNDGCEGGALEPTFDYVVNVGITSEDNYPYTATVSKCKFTQEKSIGRIKDYMSIDEGDEATMEYVLNKIGPIAVGLDASHQSFLDYKEGIYYEPKCKSDIESLTHAVALVGYGVEDDGQRYWLIRNSYGVNWGENGYGKIARDPPNHCGISTYAVYPIVD